MRGFAGDNDLNGFDSIVAGSTFFIGFTFLVGDLSGELTFYDAVNLAFRFAIFYSRSYSGNLTGDLTGVFRTPYDICSISLSYSSTSFLLFSSCSWISFNFYSHYSFSRRSLSSRSELTRFVISS